MLKERILKLKKEGLTQSEIALKLDCARSTVCWHFNPEKQLKKSQDRKKKIPEHMVKWQRNISRFSTAKTKTKQKIEIKDLTFSEASANFRDRLKSYSKIYK